MATEEDVNRNRLCPMCKGPLPPPRSLHIFCSDECYEISITEWRLEYMGRAT